MNWNKSLRIMRLRRSIAVLLLATLLIWGPAPGAAAADSFDRLVTEIRAANSSGSGEISLSEDIVLTAPLPVITGSVTIDGGGHTISGDDAYRIFDVAGGALNLKNVTLTRGNGGEGSGGAIRMRNGARVVIENSTLSRNKARDGGAIYASGGAIRVLSSKFEKNCAESVSSVLNTGGRGVEREERNVDSNGCVDVTHFNSSLDFNESHNYGGAIRLLNGALARIEESIFSENRATRGGAIAAET